MSTPAITKIVAEKREVLAAQKHAVELLEAEIRGMELILAMIPQTPLASAKQYIPGSLETPFAMPRSNVGRQPGAISSKWKRHLLALNEAQSEFSLEDIIELVSEREGRTMRPSEVKRIFDKYVEQGHVEENANLYVMPESTVQKFKSALREAGDDLSDDEEAAATTTSKKDKLSAMPSEKNGYELDDDITYDSVKSQRKSYHLDDDIPF